MLCLGAHMLGQGTENGVAHRLRHTTMHFLPQLNLKPQRLDHAHSQHAQSLFWRCCASRIRHRRQEQSLPGDAEGFRVMSKQCTQGEAGIITCLTIPRASMRATPIPALPAPTSTMRCFASSLLLFPCTLNAPYTPATAVAAVPCMHKRLTW